MRQIGLYPTRWPGLSLEDRVNIIADTGFDYLCASSIGQLIQEEDKDNLLYLAKEYSLPVDNVHLTGKDTNLIWAEGPQGDAIAERYMQEMRLAIEAGVERGIVHVTWGLIAPALTQIGMDRFGKMVCCAERLGFTICFENSVSVKHLCAVLDGYPSKAAGFCLDSGHWHAFAPGSDIAKRYADRMCAVHLQDNDGARDLHMIPLDGCVPFADLRSALQGVQRLTLETVGMLKKEYPGETADTLASELHRLPVYREGLVRTQDGGFTVYEQLDYRSYMKRMHTAGLRLAGMIEEGGIDDV